MRGIMNDPKNEHMTFLMASHGAAIRGILSGLLDLPLEKFWDGGVHKNCAVTLLHAEKGTFEVVFENRVYY